MTGPEVLDIARDSILTLVVVSAPLVLLGWRRCRVPPAKRPGTAVAADHELPWLAIGTGHRGQIDERRCHDCFYASLLAIMLS